jgi:beta-glucuronidase
VLEVVHRSFTETTRYRRYLDGDWEFVPDPADTVSPDEIASNVPADSHAVTVPAAWNADPRFHDHEGIAWYKRSFEMPECSHTRIRFEAVSHTADVYLDGEHRCHHYGAFTPFEIVEYLEAGEHELVVRVDSEPTNETLPLPEVNWFHYGGITRPVFVEVVPDVYIDDIRVDYELDGTVASVEAKVDVATPGTGSGEKEQLSLRLDDTLVGETTFEPAGSTVTVGFERGVDLWDPDDPTLYRIEASLDRSGDVFRDRIGFRTIAVDGNDVLLNGEPVSFRGTNRLEDHPDWGPALPKGLSRRDVEILDGAGMNVVRDHYPERQYFLDLCDERGIMVVESIPIWQFDGDDFARGTVLERGKQMLREVISRDYNRPSVVSWSLHNECETQEQGVYEATEDLAAVARNADGSRLTTYASNNAFEGEADICYDLVDYASVNAYYGWYEEMDDWEAFLREEVIPAVGERPVVLSEFGGGSVYGDRTLERRRWSEGYQADLLVEIIEAVESIDEMAGFWTFDFCDYRVGPRRFESRPKNQNNKGMVDVYRRPKDAYWRVREVLTGKQHRHLDID